MLVAIHSYPDAMHRLFIANGVKKEEAPAKSHEFDLVCNILSCFSSAAQRSSVDVHAFLFFFCSTNKLHSIKLLE